MKRPTPTFSDHKLPQKHEEKDEEDDQSTALEEMQELVENLEDLVHKVVEECSKNSNEVSDIKTSF